MADEITTRVRAVHHWPPETPSELRALRGRQVAITTKCGLHQVGKLKTVYASTDPTALSTGLFVLVEGGLSVAWHLIDKVEEVGNA